jgi:exonuclease SbcD
MRFVHAADIHLDSPLAGLRGRAGDRAGEFAGATRRAFNSFIDAVIAERADFVVIAGDLYDGNWRDFTTGLVFVDGMARLAREGIRVALIKGNHDAENLMTRQLRLPDNVHLFSADAPGTWLLDDLRVAVHGRSFARRDVTENLAAHYPDAKAGHFNVGLLHTSADGRPGHSPYAPCGLDDLRARGYDYWALGHIHEREVLCEDPWIVFCGNLQGRHVNEPGAKGFSLVTVENGRVCSVEHVAVDVMRWAELRVDVGGAATFDEACERIRRGMDAVLPSADGRTLAVRIVLTGATAAHCELAGDLDRISAECASLALQSAGDVWVERVKIETTPIVGAGASMSDAVAELLRTIGDIRADPAERDEMRAALRGGLERVPAPVRQVAGLDGGEAEALDRLLADAEAMLLHRLLSPDGSSA